jgi:hypothetical protein
MGWRLSVAYRGFDVDAMRRVTLVVDVMERLLVHGPEGDLK